MQYKLLNYWLKNMVYKKFLIYIIILLSIASCTLPDNWSGWFSRPYWGMDNLPPADTDYGRGFENGCKHGLYVVSKGYMASDLAKKKKLYIDELINNEEFALGYYDGYEQCVYVQDWDVV